MNKVMIIGVIITIISIGFTIIALSSIDPENTDIEKIESPEIKEPKHYSASLEDGIGISHIP